MLPDVADSVAATVTSCSRGVLTYNRYAILSHHPNVFISESCIPFLASVGAAPILKLFVWSMPICCGTSCTFATKRSLVSGRPSLNRINSPFPVLLIAIYERTAASGQSCPLHG